MPLLGPEVAEVARLVGDPARANMLEALLDNRARTASELACMAQITPQTASSHLARLTTANMLRVEKQGRHRYYRLASPDVATMLESVMNVAARTPPRWRPPSKLDDDMRMARSCYDHLAGRLGVGLADALQARGLIVLDGDGGHITDDGFAFFARHGIELDTASPKHQASSRRAYCRPCLDWSERRFHLAGRIGAAMLRHSLEHGWLQRQGQTRALLVTQEGTKGLTEVYRIDRSILTTASIRSAAD